MSNPYEKSEHFTAFARHYTPGASQTASKAPGRAGPLGGYPALMQRAEGAYTWDVDDIRYIDCVCGLAAVAIGHADPRVCSTVKAAVDRGALLSLPHVLESSVASDLCEAINQPWAQQVRWVKTGSEATEAALRIARCATGRDHVLMPAGGYAGWHSLLVAGKPSHPGVPEAMAQLVHAKAHYGDTAAITGALSSGLFAAILLEPAPAAGGGNGQFLEDVVAAARDNGTLVIFDEMVWGFRLALAGGSQYFAVQPDMATYGKALGNGHAIAGIVGPSDLMQHASLVSGTFGGDLVGLAAAMTVLNIYASDGIIETLWQRGEQVQALLKTACEEFPALQAQCSGYAVRPVLSLAPDGEDPAMVMSLFLQELAARGVLGHSSGAFNICAALSPLDASAVGVSARLALAEVATAVYEHKVRTQLVGEPFTQPFTRATVTA